MIKHLNHKATEQMFSSRQISMHVSVLSPCLHESAFTVSCYRLIAVNGCRCSLISINITLSLSYSREMLHMGSLKQTTRLHASDSTYTM